MDQWLVEREEVIRGLRVLRNKRLAHFDVPAELPGGITYGDFTDLLEDLNKYSTDLQLAFRGHAATMDLAAKEVRQDTEALRRALVKVRREEHRRWDEYLSALDQ